MIIGRKKFVGYTYVMAIINLTPDSFYAPSRADSSDILFRVERAIADGAAVIDIGAQSTRPGYREVPAEEEISRLGGCIYDIKRNFDIPVSVDTYFARTAEAALQAGADMINDVWGLSKDSDMAKTIARHGASVCIMHNSAKKIEGDVFAPVKSFLAEGVERALKAGIDGEKILLDGGIGFAKDAAQSLALLQGYEKLGESGYPLLLGASRKSLFGGDVNERLAQTLASTRLACEKGVLFVRVHDVKQNCVEIERFYDKRG